MAIPNLAMIPSAYKATKLYSVLPTSGVGDFTVSRPIGGAGTTGNATRVNSAGLIETVAANVPRLDYSDGGCPVLLTEPQSTNEFLWSLDFSKSEYSKINSIVTINNSISPDGTLNASLLEDNNAGGTGIVQLPRFSKTLPLAGVYTFSYFVKQVTNKNIALGTSGFDVSANGTTQFNLETNDVTKSPQHISAKIEDYANGWKRISVTFETTVDLVGSLTIYLVADNSNQTVNLDGTNKLEIWQSQIEKSPYATSPIKTEGTAITRVADVVDGSLTVDTVNDSEGTIFAEFASITETPDSPYRFSLVGVTSSDYVSIGYANGISNTVKVILVVGGTPIINQTFAISSSTDYNKIAVTFKNNEFRAFINGVNVFQDLTQPTFYADGTLKGIAFNGYNAFGNFRGRTKQIQQFNTALTEAEVITLTTI